MRKKGFTLVELIAVIAILFIISSVTYSIYSNGNRIYSIGTSQVKMQDTGRKAMEAIASSIKNAQLTGTTNFVQLSGITFANGIAAKIQTPLILINPADNSTNYLYAIENNNELHKIFVGTNGVDQLVCYNIDYITIIPLAQQPNTFSIKVGSLYNGNKVSYATLASIGSMINTTNSINLSGNGAQNVGPGIVDDMTANSINIAGNINDPTDTITLNSSTFSIYSPIYFQGYGINTTSATVTDSSNISMMAQTVSLTYNTFTVGSNSNINAGNISLNNMTAALGNSFIQGNNFNYSQCTVNASKLQYALGTVVNGQQSTLNCNSITKNVPLSTTAAKKSLIINSSMADNHEVNGNIEFWKTSGSNISKDVHAAFKSNSQYKVIIIDGDCNIDSNYNPYNYSINGNYSNMIILCTGTFSVKSTTLLLNGSEVYSNGLNIQGVTFIMNQSSQLDLSSQTINQQLTNYLNQYLLAN